MNQLKMIEPYGAAFYENRKRPLNIRMAMASRETAKYCDLRIDERQFIGYTSASCATSSMYYTFGSGISVNENGFRDNQKKYPEFADTLQKILEYVCEFDTHYQIDRHQDKYEQELTSTGACWGGGWAGHSNPDYDLLLHLGTTGLRNKIAECRKKNPDKADFYEGCEIFMDALDILGDRLHVLSLEMAGKTEDAIARAEYFKMSEAYTVIPRKPAYNMRSAVLFFWMVFTFDGIDSPGRLDQFFLDFWRMDDPEEAFLQLERLWQAFHDTRTWNLCICGSDENWNDKTNEVSLAVLDLAAKYRYQTPNILSYVSADTATILCIFRAICRTTLSPVQIFNMSLLLRMQTGEPFKERFPRSKPC